MEQGEFCAGIGWTDDSYAEEPTGASQGGNPRLPAAESQLKAGEEKAEEVEQAEPWAHSPGRSWQLCPVGAGTTNVIDCSLGCCLRQRGRSRNTLTFPYSHSPITFQLTFCWLRPVGSQETLGRWGRGCYTEQSRPSRQRARSGSKGTTLSIIRQLILGHSPGQCYCPGRTY